VDYHIVISVKYRHRVDGIAWTGRHNDTLYRSFGTWYHSTLSIEEHTVSPSMVADTTMLATI